MTSQKLAELTWKAAQGNTKAQLRLACQLSLPREQRDFWLAKATGNPSFCPENLATK